IRLEAEIEPDVGEVLGDPNRLQQVVCNLVTNAVKFTPEGGLVEVRLGGRGATGTLVVAGNGGGNSAGFPPHRLPRVRPTETGATQRSSGLGLGLAIVHHLVEEHGGTIRAESPGEGLGATFTVTLPLFEPLSQRASTAVATEETSSPK